MPSPSPQTFPRTCCLKMMWFCTRCLVSIMVCCTCTLSSAVPWMRRKELSGIFSTLFIRLACRSKYSLGKLSIKPGDSIKCLMSALQKDQLKYSSTPQKIWYTKCTQLCHYYNVRLSNKPQSDPCAGNSWAQGFPGFYIIHHYLKNMIINKL